MSCELSYPFQVRTWGRVGPVFALVALLRHWLSRPGHCYHLLAYGDPSLDLARGSYLPNLRLPVPYIGFFRHKEFLSPELRSPLPTHLRLHHYAEGEHADTLGDADILATPICARTKSTTNHHLSILTLRLHRP